MKRVSPLLALCLLCAGIARADLVVVQKVESKGQSGEMTMQLKDSKSRMDVSPAMSVILDKDTGDLVTLMHAKKMFMRLSGDAARALIAQVKAAAPNDNPAPKLQPTGKKEKINGYDTDEYTATVGAMKMSYWIAKGYPGYAGILAQMMQFQKSSLSSLVKGIAPDDFPGLPIRTQMTGEGRDTTMTLVSITQGPVDPKIFEVPADYKELTTPAFIAPALAQ